MSGGPNADGGWTLAVDPGVTYTEDANGVQFVGEGSGIIHLEGGSQLAFHDVERIIW